MSSRCVVVGFRARLGVTAGAETSVHPNNEALDRVALSSLVAGYYDRPKTRHAI